MALPMLQPGERVVARESVCLTTSFWPTVGDLFLTDRRLVLHPDQFLSVGLGRPMEVPLDQVTWRAKFGRFQGGSYIGAAGKKITVGTADGAEHTFSFVFGSDVDAFYAALCDRDARRPAPVVAVGDSPPPLPGRIPKPSRGWAYWLMRVVTVGALLLIVGHWIGLHLEL